MYDLIGLDWIGLDWIELLKTFEESNFGWPCWPKEAHEVSLWVSTCKAARPCTWDSIPREIPST